MAEANSSNSENILDFYLSNMNTYYNVQKFLLLYEGIPIVFSELGIFETTYEQIIKIRKILREMFGVDDSHYNEKETIKTRTEIMRDSLKKTLMQYVYRKLNEDATLQQDGLTQEEVEEEVEEVEEEEVEEEEVELIF